MLLGGSFLERPSYMGCLGERTERRRMSRLQKEPFITIAFATLIPRRYFVYCLLRGLSKTYS